MNFLDMSKQIGEILTACVPKDWDGKQSIMYMRDNESRNWRQMEWMGFYFQFLCENVLVDLMEIPGPKFGKTVFDGFFNIPWDFKTHAMNTSSHKIIVNDSEATAKAIEKHGEIGLILALGKVVYNDEARTFQAWHTALKGGPSKYELARIKRGAWSRLRKVSFGLEQISLIRLTEQTLAESCSFQGSFRNSDGKPRRAKVLLDLEKIDENLVYFIEF